MVKLSVITVCRNAASTLPKALESLRAQAYPNLEYIVLDAASTDGTLALLDQYKDIITFQRSEKDGGPNAAYNEGIERATGDYVAFLNADDWYEPGILHAVAEAAQNTPDVISFEAKVWNGEKLARHYKSDSLGLTPASTPAPNARFFHKSVFQRFGLFLTQNHKGERLIAADLEYLLRLSQHHLSNVVLSRVGYNYLMHEGSQTFAKDPARERQMYDERAWIAETYLQKGTLPAYKSRLNRWHLRGLSRGYFWRMEEGDAAGAMQALKTGWRMHGLRFAFDWLRLSITGKYKRL